MNWNPEMWVSPGLSAVQYLVVWTVWFPIVFFGTILLTVMSTQVCEGATRDLDRQLANEQNPFKRFLIYAGAPILVLVELALMVVMSVFIFSDFTGGRRS